MVYQCALRAANANSVQAPSYVDYFSLTSPRCYVFQSGNASTRKCEWWSSNNSEI